MTFRLFIHNGKILMALPMKAIRGSRAVNDYLSLFVTMGFDDDIFLKMPLKSTLRSLYCVLVIPSVLQAGPMMSRAGPLNLLWEKRVIPFVLWPVMTPNSLSEPMKKGFSRVGSIFLSLLGWKWKEWSSKEILAGMLKG